MSPLWTLVPLSLLAGGVLMWAFRRMADVAGIGRAAARIQAHLLEFWLFVDEPSLVWKSWRGLLGANARFLRLLLVPLVVLSIPMVPAWFVLDALYGNAPLVVNQPALVTAGVGVPLERLAAPPELRPPEGISVESPPLRVFSERQVSWRIRPLKAVSGTLLCSLDGESVGKSVAAGTGVRYLSRKRSRSLMEFLLSPAEAPLGAGPVEWIEVSYPAASIPVFGYEAHWSIWFLLFSLPGAVVSAKL